MTAGTGSCPAEGGQDVELPRLEVARGEGGLPSAVEVLREAADPRQDVERGEVEIGALAVPGVDDAVDFVLRDGRALRILLRHPSIMSAHLLVLSDGSLGDPARPARERPPLRRLADWSGVKARSALV